MRLASRRPLLMIVAASHAALAAQAPARDSVVYHLVSASRFDVRTGKSGVLGFAGHEHLIRAHRISGRVIYVPGAPLRSQVDIRVPTEGLKVLTPPDSEEIRKVTSAMRTEVLHVDRYPEIVFVSRTLEQESGGFRITGKLTIAGQTREVPVRVAVKVGHDTLRATATFEVKQSDFGIKPYRGGPGGTVRVADRVTFDIAAVAVREGH
jgi:polyisoprenoid-binding protein YceI